MHNNVIHDLALACWSVLLPPIKRAASLTNFNSQGKVVCDWLFFNRNISRHFVLVGGNQPIDPVLSAMSSSTENQNVRDDQRRGQTIFNQMTPDPRLWSIALFK